jgi:large subunit ribosomal protein L16
MLQPKRVKFRKSHKGHRRGMAHSGATILFGDFALQAVEPAWITARQIEAARRAMVRYIRRGGKVWIRIFPDHPVTAKPAETRQGGGKGSPDHWVAVVRPGRILFELGGVPEDLAKEAMRLAAYKLPIHTKFLVKDSGAEAAADSGQKELTQVES